MLPVFSYPQPAVCSFLTKRQTNRVSELYDSSVAFKVASNMLMMFPREITGPPTENSSSFTSTPRNTNHSNIGSSSKWTVKFKWGRMGHDVQQGVSVPESTTKILYDEIFSDHVCVFAEPKNISMGLLCWTPHKYCKWTKFLQDGNHDCSRIKVVFSRKYRKK